VKCAGAPRGGCQLNLNTGSVCETIAIELPAGTAGLTPSLALTYDSGQGNGPLGIGWSLGVSTIQLQTEKGVVRRAVPRSPASFCSI
jgi:hypothetical protein